MLKKRWKKFDLVNVIEDGGECNGKGGCGDGGDDCGEMRDEWTDKCTFEHLYINSCFCNWNHQLVALLSRYDASEMCLIRFQWQWCGVWWCMMMVDGEDEEILLYMQTGNINFINWTFNLSQQQYRGIGIDGSSSGSQSSVVSFHQQIIIRMEYLTVWIQQIRQIKFWILFSLFVNNQES